MSLQQLVTFQANTFNNNITYTAACRMLNTQTTFIPTHIAPDLVRWEGSGGISVGYNKRTKMVIIKSASLKVLFTATGQLGEHMFRLMIQPKIRAK